MALLACSFVVLALVLEAKVILWILSTIIIRRALVAGVPPARSECVCECPGTVPLSVPSRTPKLLH